MRPVARELLLAALGPAAALPTLVVAMYVPFDLSPDVLRVRVMHSILHVWWRYGPANWALLAMLAVAVSYPVRALLLLRRREDAPQPGSATLGLLATLGAASSATFALMAVGVVQLARRAIHLEQVKTMLFYFYRFEREVAAWALTGGGLVILAALWTAVGVIATRRRRLPAAALLLPLAAVVGLVGASLLRYWVEIATLSSEWMPPADRYRNIVEVGAPLSQGCTALIVAAALAAAAIVIVTRRDRLANAPRDLRASAFVLVLGLAAFALTRSFAHDARHPLPLWEPGGGAQVSKAYVGALPPGDHCQLDLQDAPTLWLGESQWAVDGVGNDGPTMDDFRKLLVNKRELWKQVQPNKSFPGLLVAGIPAALPISRVRPFVEAAREAGYPHLSLLEGLPARTFATRTLGVLEYSPRLCFVTANADDAVPDAGTLGEWASKLAQR